MATLNIRFIDPTLGTEDTKGFSDVTLLSVDTSPNGRLEVKFSRPDNGETRTEHWTDVTWYRFTE